LLEGDVQECHDLVGGFLVVVLSELGYSEVRSFLDGNVEVKVFDIEWEGSVMGVDRKLYEFVCRAVGSGGVVEVVWVQVVVQDGI
jgi:hypothetical protein